jgi:amino acid adenylation domain-containing protein
MRGRSEASNLCRSSSDATTVRPARSPIVPRSGETEVPLSFAQQRLWLVDQLEPTSWTYNITVARRLRGALQLDPLQRALDALLARHEALRTTYPVVDEHPVQRIRPPAPFELRIVDLTGWDDVEAEARRVADEEVRRRFNLTEGPITRGMLVRLSPEDQVLVLTMHHIATDAWSEAVLLHELSVLYDAFANGQPSPLPPLPIQYADFAVWQRQRIAGDVLHDQLEYWQHRLQGMAPLLEIPADHPRPPRRTGRGGTVDIQISAPLTTALRRVTRAARATLFMTVLAGFQSLLARYSGQDDIVVGTAIANRPRQETEGLVGFFANTLVLRTHLSDNPSFLDVIARVREVALGAYRHQDLPFEHLVKAMGPERTLGHTSLFQHMFVFQNALERDLTLDGLTTERFALDHDTAMFDLTLTLSEGQETIVGTLEYATDLFDRTTAERMAGHLSRLLEAAVADPDRPIDELDFLDHPERHKVLVEWNDTRTNPENRCIHDLFEERAAAHPDAIALTAGDESLTYRELDERSGVLARRLRALGVGPDARVGIYLYRSADAIVAILATLKAGGAYVPLDPDYPVARLAFMVEDSDVEVVVTGGALGDRLGWCRAHILRMDVDNGSMAEPTNDNPVGTARSENLAYIVYTSGSTGTPKGVMVEHRAVVARMIGVDYIHFDKVGAVLHMAPLAFDASTFEIWGPLLHGACCVVYPDQRFALDRFGTALAANVDTLWLTSAVFNTVIDEDWRLLGGIRQLIVGGEALSADHVAKATALLPQMRLVNGYGPTEATTFAACHEIRAMEPGTGRVPIGRPIANTELYILDGCQRPAPIGIPGELYLGGAGLARGYINRPELTAERFVPHPFCADPEARLYRTGDLARYRSNGEVEFLGRLDDQIKIRGFRVEPGEVEAVLRQLPAVATAAVMGREGDRGQRRLVAYVVRGSSKQLSARKVRDHLRSRLPEYLVPDGIVIVDSLPLTPNGKLDRKALAALEVDTEAEVAYAAPSTAVERGLADLWAEIFGVERVGVDDNFFSLGGDSLLAAELFAKMTRWTSKTIPLALLFSGPTIREVAVALDDDGAKETSMVALRSDGTRPPLFLAHGISGELFVYLHLVRRLGSDQPVYGFRVTTSLVGTQPLRIPDLATRYVADILRVQPTGPYRLAGFCFGGLVVVEIAHQLEQLGHEVAFLGLFDADVPSSPPPRRDTNAVASVWQRNKSVVAYVRRRLENALIKARHRPRLIARWLLARNREDDVERVETVYTPRVLRPLKIRRTSYATTPTTCTVTLFRPGAPKVQSGHVRMVPGAEGADECYLIDGPGVSHLTLMSEPHVRLLAGTLTERLDRIGADPASLSPRAPESPTRQ